MVGISLNAFGLQHRFEKSNWKGQRVDGGQDGVHFLLWLQSGEDKDVGREKDQEDDQKHKLS